MVKITEERIKNLIKDIKSEYYQQVKPLEAECIVDSKAIPYSELENKDFFRIHTGQKWGSPWDSCWFRFTGIIPDEYAGKKVAALIDIGSEGCVFYNGSPYSGITYKREHGFFERKRRIVLFQEAQGGETVNILVEGAANALLGRVDEEKEKWPFFTLNQAEIAIFDEDVWKISMDMDFLFQLYGVLDPESPRAKRILRGLNSIANIVTFPISSCIDRVKKMTKQLLETPAVPSAQTVWSVGHAHLDLAWLWPKKETRRKAGRTFSTALRMIEEYPEYIFGASQPQLFEWVKQDYPKLFQDVKAAVAAERLECQGCMWVEPDMNLPSGESLVRQCYYGIKYFQDEFGETINYLWLPDVFGYSAALPQILKKSGVSSFITQKISWNETNVFPHHTFLWYGIDGTSVKTHFLPTNDYNGTNEPKQLAEAEKRFAQSDVQDGFLNLYGVGDGGGGPSRRHIEWGKRSRNCEGLPKFTFAKAADYVKYLEAEDTSALPSWKGELYLELHRGTYTTQAKMKWYNRKLELALRETEILGSIAIQTYHGSYPKREIETIWKETLLNQFHDILPGSSIKEVYDEVYAESEKNLKKIDSIKKKLQDQIVSIKDTDKLTVFNSQPWERIELVSVDNTSLMIRVPSMGFRVLSKQQLQEMSEQQSGSVSVNEDASCLESNIVRVELHEDGSIHSLFLKENKKEFFTERGGGLFYLFEDKPYDWDAWDISPYYTETLPEQAELVERTIIKNTSMQVQIKQVFSLGASSRIEQILELREGEALLRASCKVDWHEQQKMLRLCAYPNVSWPTAVYEIQYGNIERPTHTDTSWDKAKFEVCGHRYADLSQPNCGLALINDCKYGYRIQEGVMELNILRSPLYPDSTADRGEHEFSYAYLPHASSFYESSVVQQAHNFNSPLSIIQGSLKDTSDEKSHYRFDAPQVKIETVKPAENQKGIILRCYETLGGDCRGTLSTPPISEAYSVNMLEEEALPLEVCNGNEISLNFGPYEVKTILIR